MKKEDQKFKQGDRVRFSISGLKSKHQSSFSEKYARRPADRGTVKEYVNDMVAVVWDKVGDRATIHSEMSLLHESVEIVLPADYKEPPKAPDTDYHPLPESLIAPALGGIVLKKK